MSSVVADGWIVRAQHADELTFDAEYFRLRGIPGFPEDLFADAEISEFVPGEVLADQVGVDAAEVCRSVRQVTADVDLSVGIRNFINDLVPISHRYTLGFGFSLLRGTRRERSKHRSCPVPLIAAEGLPVKIRVEGGACAIALATRPSGGAGPPNPRSWASVSSTRPSISRYSGVGRFLSRSQWRTCPR